MKKQIYLFLAIILLLPSCGSKNSKSQHRSDFLPPIEIEIPDAIKDDAELVDLVKESEEAINEFSNNMEQLIEDIKPYKNLSEEDASTLDKLKVAKIAGEFMLNSTNGLQVLEKISNYSDKRIEQEKPLNDQQLEAMAVIYDTFEDRMKQLEEKYEGLTLSE